MTDKQPDDTCPGREGKYVPWSFGVLFDCTTCGAWVRQSHHVEPLSDGMPDYDSVYPIPPHQRRSAE